MEIIADKAGQTLVIVHRSADWKAGLDFITPNDFPVQAGCWKYSSGKKLAHHYHKENIRTVNMTQELTFIKQGRMRAFIYDNTHTLVRELDLVAGDFAIFASGGHGYEILDDNTQVLEVKNGPFVSVEKDKSPIAVPSMGVAEKVR